MLLQDKQKDSVWFGMLLHYLHSLSINEYHNFHDASQQQRLIWRATSYKLLWLRGNKKLLEAA
jgi:hypothetical protein